MSAYEVQYGVERSEHRVTEFTTFAAARRFAAEHPNPEGKPFFGIARIEQPEFFVQAADVDHYEATLPADRLLEIARAEWTALASLIACLFPHIPDDSRAGVLAVVEEGGEARIRDFVGDVRRFQNLLHNAE